MVTVKETREVVSALRQPLTIPYTNGQSCDVDESSMPNEVDEMGLM